MGQGGRGGKEREGEEVEECRKRRPYSEARYLVTLVQSVIEARIATNICTCGCANGLQRWSIDSDNKAEANSGIQNELLRQLVLSCVSAIAYECHSYCTGLVNNAPREVLI
jgi:hypothetical protein